MGAHDKLSGQGATEYLVLLAVVLIVALVSIALLGFFPGLSTDAKITQSKSYWSGARPFAITEYAISAATTNAALVLQNNDAASTLTITSITLALPNGTRSVNSSGATLGPGESKAMGVSCANVSSGAVAGGSYGLKVTINYTASNGISNAQTGGDKLLSGKYY